MSASGLEVFDRTLQEKNIWPGEIAEKLGPDRQVAYRVLRAVLHAPRDRLTVEQAAHLSAQLPMLIRGIYYEAYHPAKSPPSTVRSRAEFLDVISDELSGQLEKVFWSLPEGVRQLFGSMETVDGGA